MKWIYCQHVNVIRTLNIFNVKLNEQPNKIKEINVFRGTLGGTVNKT